MSMRIHRLTTYLHAAEAHTLIEFLDQLRDMLMQTYGDDIKILLQEVSQREPMADEAQQQLF